MNKKKLLLSTAIATTMLISGIAMPKTLASTEANRDVRTSTFQANDSAYTITVALPKLSQEQVNNLEYPTLTKSDVEDIIKNEKFANPNMDVKFDDKSEKSGTVGTEAKVTINDKEFSVVLYGDLNGDGKVNLIDASMLYNYFMDNSSVNLSDLAEKAGDIITNQKLNLVDAAAIYNSVMGKFDTFSKIQLPDDNLIVLDADVKEAVDLLDTELYTPTIKEEDGKTVINLAVNEKDTNGDTLYVMDAFDDIVDAFLGDNAKALRDDAFEAYKENAIEEITIKIGDKEKKYTQIISNQTLKQKLDKAIENNNAAELKNLLKQEIGDERIKNWEKMPLTDLIQKSQIEIDVNFKETAKDLLLDSKLHQVYIIDFVDSSAK